MRPLASTSSSQSSLVLLVLQLVFSVNYAQITELHLSDEANSQGWLIARVETGHRASVSGLVCGAVDANTATIACRNLGWLFTTGYGTVQTLGFNAPNRTAVVKDLSCSRLDTVNGVNTLTCTYSSDTSGCALQDSAAVKCYFTEGQLIGIIFGAVGLVVLVSIPIVILIVLCCCGIGCAAVARKA